MFNSISIRCINQVGPFPEIKTLLTLFFEIPTRNICSFNPQESTAWYAQIGSSPQVRVKIRKIFETIMEYSSIFVVCVGDLSLIYFHMLLTNFLVSSQFQLSLWWFGAIYLGSIHRHIGSLSDLVSQRVPPRPQVTLHLKKNILKT